jgi:hypothetical protein
MFFKVFTPSRTVSFFDNSEAIVSPKRRYEIIQTGVTAQKTVSRDSRWGKKLKNSTMNKKIRLSSISVNTADILHYSSDSDEHIHAYRKVMASTPYLRT